MDEQQVINAAEQFLEAAEGKVETIVPEVARRVNMIQSNPYVFIGVGAFVGAAVGVAVGWKLAKRHLEPKYQAIAEQEIREAREHYSKVGVVAKKAEYPTVTDAVQELIPPSHEEAKAALKVYQGQGSTMSRTVEITDDGQGIHVKTEEQVDTAPKVKQRNIFLDGEPINEDEWDYDVELEQRTDDKPYIIHEDEFNENEPDYEDMVLTYYAGDDVLANDQDEPVDDVEGLVGRRNLRKFGHGASDPNMLHVRNNLRGLNIEISRSSGKYGTLVLNYDAEDDVPAERPSRRPRRGDGDE